MEPAASVIKKLGGHAVVSEYLRTSKKTPYVWTYSKEKGGTGGVIPHWHHEDLLLLARERGVDLTKTELVEGVASEATA